MAPAASSLSRMFSPLLWPGLFLCGYYLGDVGEWAELIGREHER